MRGRPILAAIFVALTAFVLSIPLRDTEPAISAGVDATPSVEKTNEPVDGGSPTPDATETPPDEPVDEFAFSGSYPEECLTEVSAPEDDGHLAIDQEKGIEITDPAGGEPILVEDKFPFKWSPSGTFLAAGNGAIYDSTGRQAMAAPEGDGPYSWAWSPIADCLLVSSGSETLVVVPGSGTTVLHDAGLSRFSFSPGGGDLAFGTIGDDKTLWVASLSDGDARRLKTFPLDEGAVVVLAGWTPNASHVLFWRGQATDLLSEGVPLFALSAEREVSQLAGAVLAHRDFVTTCGQDVLGVVGSGARAGFNSKRVARLGPGSEPSFITPEDAHDVSPSCSPDAEFIALIRSDTPSGEGPDRLTIIDQEGSVLFQPSDTGYNDAYPLWGRGESGVLFIRKPPGREPQVWHVTTESPASPTGATLRAAGRDANIFRDGWGHFLDWSADQPTGVSVVSGGE